MLQSTEPETLGNYEGLQGPIGLPGKGKYKIVLGWTVRKTEWKYNEPNVGGFLKKLTGKGSFHGQVETWCNREFQDCTRITSVKLPNINV